MPTASMVRLQFQTPFFIEMVITDLLSFFFLFFLSFFIIYSTVKWFMTDFEILFFLMSLSSVLLFLLIPTIMPPDQRVLEGGCGFDLLYYYHYYYYQPDYKPQLIEQNAINQKAPAGKAIPRKKR